MTKSKHYRDLILLSALLALLAGCAGSGSSTPSAHPSQPETPNQPGPEIPTPVAIPRVWGFYGDSHTAGRGNIASSASPSLVFRAIWASSGFETPIDIEVNGSSGRSLAGTREAFEADTFTQTPWIHAQESGNQNSDGQRTPQEFGATFESFWRAVDARYPDALKSYETAHSFQLIGGTWRDWQTTANWADWGYADASNARSYNEEMQYRIDLLAEDGIVVIPVYTAELIDALIARIPGGYLSIEDDSIRHYNGVGNFLIALATFHSLGFDVTTLDFSTVTIHEDPTTDAAYKALCVNVIVDLGGD